MKTTICNLNLSFKFTISSLFIVILFNLNTKAKAQNQALDSVNLQLRQLFVNLDRPTQPKEFLYEMTGHLTDSVFFQVNCPDTNTTHIFQRMYEEIYHSAYDTTTLIYPDTLFARGNGFTNDTIPVGIINYSHYLLKSEALTTDTYFYFDTINTILTDKYPRPGFPYDEGRVFIAAPLVPNTHFANPVFRIDPQFILFDQFNNPVNNGKQLYIDFGDGNGWIYFDHTIITHHNVLYTEKGNRTIKFKWEVDGDPQTSISRIFNPNLTVLQPANAYFTFPGINAGLYKSCNSGDGFKGRTVIYLSGFDLMDFVHSTDRKPDQIYSEMILTNEVVQLRNNGYDFLVVDWKDSRIDIRFNALYLVNLLQQLKETVITNGDREQFVIMGESMGGLIARYALTFMESEDYLNEDIDRFFVDEFDDNNLPYLLSHPDIFSLPENWENKQEMHNTRLLITLDAPHQGANIPISVQKAYKRALKVFGPHIGLGLQNTTTMYNLFLESHAGQQMLLYHADTESGAGIYKTYSRHPAGESFYSDLQQEGNGYPQHCKVVLMSNGALNGENQTNFYTNTPRSPNDRMIEFKTDLYVRVLWIKVPLFGGELTLRTNPDGNGKVLQGNAGSYGVRIKLKWFGVRIHTGYNSIFEESSYVNTIPFCSAAGGRLGKTRPGIVGEDAHTTHFPDAFIFHLIGYDLTNDSEGCITFESHIGPNGFSSTNFDYSICTDGFNFNFVPIQSALDYGIIANTPPLGFNIQENHTIAEKLANVPVGVDMIIGRNELQAGGIRNNFPHLGYRNDYIWNLTGQSATIPLPSTWFSMLDHTYYSCVSENNLYDSVRRGFLNLEIGDEELYLENNILAWNATFVSEYDIHVNDRNPHYEYQIFSNPVFLLEGIYSRDDDFIIDNNTGFATFVYDDNNTPTGIGFNFTNPNGNWTETNQAMDVCCVNYVVPESRPEKPKTQRLLQNNHTSFITVYPNPTSGTKAMVKYKFKKVGKVNMEIYNLSGQRLLLKKLPVDDCSKENISVIELGDLRLLPGMYLIRINNGDEILKAKIIILK